MKIVRWECSLEGLALLRDVWGRDEGEVEDRIHPGREIVLRLDPYRETGVRGSLGDSRLIGLLHPAITGVESILKLLEYPLA